MPTAKKGGGRMDSKKSGEEMLSNELGKTTETEEINALYEKYLGGDEKAFEQLMAFIYKDLIFFINRYVNDIYTAEDLAEDTFVKLLENKKRFDSSRSSLKTFLFTVGKNLALDYLRKNKKTAFSLSLSENTDIPSEEMELADYIIKRENSRLLYSAVKKLPTLESKVIHLLYFENMSYKEISKILEIPVKNLYEISRAAKEKLEKNLKNSN